MTSHTCEYYEKKMKECKKKIKKLKKSQKNKKVKSKSRIFHGYCIKDSKILKVYKKTDSNKKVLYNNNAIGNRNVFKTENLAKKYLKEKNTKSTKSTKSLKTKSPKMNSWLKGVSDAKKTNSKWTGIPKKNTNFYKASKIAQKKYIV
jgi:hypothetical protein